MASGAYSPWPNRAEAAVNVIKKTIQILADELREHRRLRALLPAERRRVRLAEDDVALARVQQGLDEGRGGPDRQGGQRALWDVAQGALSRGV